MEGGKNDDFYYRSTFCDSNNSYHYHSKVLLEVNVANGVLHPSRIDLSRILDLALLSLRFCSIGKSIFQTNSCAETAKTAS